MAVNVAKLNYKGWENSYRLSNDLIDLVVTTDVGPRIIRFGFVNGVNEFKEFPEMLGKIGGDEWRVYGGHRFWHAPEAVPRTYAVDNGPVALERHDGFVRIVQPVESTTGIQKEIEIAVSPDQPSVKVTHRLRNHNLWAVELAPWALSVMDVGGTAILPLPPRRSHSESLLPSNTLTYWAYTDLSDPRWTVGRGFLLLRQDEAGNGSQKLGLSAPSGWIAYANRNHLFVKKAAYQEGAAYPDWGCNLETYTAPDMLEIETTGPTVKLEPQATVEHVETWFLYDGVPAPKNDQDVVVNVMPKISQK